MKVRLLFLSRGGFCRAMLRKRGLCRHAVSVRLSVRLSDTFVDSVKKNKYIFKIFHRRIEN